MVGAGRSWFLHLLPSPLVPAVTAGSSAPAQAKQAAGPRLPLTDIVFLATLFPWKTSASSVPSSVPLKYYNNVFFCFVSSLAHVLKEPINCLSHCISVRVLVVGPCGPEVILQVIASQISLPSYEFNLYLKKHDLAFCNCSK